MKCACKANTHTHTHLHKNACMRDNYDILNKIYATTTTTRHDNVMSLNSQEVYE